MKSSENILRNIPDSKRKKYEDFTYEIPKEFLRKIKMDKIQYELIVAVNHDGIIGITDANGNQRLPFTCKEDMRYFREMTTSPEGHILIMGRKTFDSLPKRPLPGRIHIVLSRKDDEKYANTKNVYFTRLEHLDDILRFARVLNPCTPLVYTDASVLNSNRRIFVCGGEEIYRILLPRCDKLHITYIDSSVVLEDGESTSQFHYLQTDFQEVENGFTSSDNTCVFKTFERITLER